MAMKGDAGKVKFMIPSQVAKMTDVREEGRSTCRAGGKDMDFITDTVRAERASTSRIGDVMIRRTEVSVSREGFTLRAEAPEVGRVWVSGEETEIEGGNEKVYPKEVGREERNVSRKTVGVSLRGGRADRVAPEGRGGRA